MSAQRKGLALSERSESKGFSLIELLVVITILALLSGIGLTIYSGAVKKGRITKRVEDLQAIKTALEIYYAKNGSYPNTGNTQTACNYGDHLRSECNGWGLLSSDQVIQGLVPTYIVSFPADPSMNKTANTSCYLYTSNGTDYKLLDHIVSEFSSTDYQSQRNLVDPARDNGLDKSIVDGTGIWAWAVWSSSNSICW